MSTPSPERLRTLALQERAFTFACTVVTACPQQIPDVPSQELWRQLVKAATSASFNLEEADEASSTRDFIAKMKLALREAKESKRCIRVIVQCKLRNYGLVSASADEARQLSSIFASIVINTKRRYDAERQAAKDAKHAKSSAQAKN